MNPHTLLITIALALLPAFASAQTAQPVQAQPPKSDLSGFWNIDAALDTDGEPYGGRVNLAYVTDSVYQMMWDTELGDYVGVGLRLGNKLYCAFGQSDFFGVTVYQNLGSFNGRGRWQGQSTMLYDEGHVYPETIDGPDLPPDASPKGKYKVLDETGTQVAELDISPIGKLHKAVYTLGNPEDKDYLVGVGMMVENRLLVAWSRTKQIGAAVYTLRNADRQADGLWAVFGVENMGTESLSR